MINEQLGGNKTPGGVFISQSKKASPYVDLRQLKKDVKNET